MIINFEFEKSYFLHRGLKTAERILYSHSQFDLFSIFVYSLSVLKMPFSLNRYFTCNTPQVVCCADAFNYGSAQLIETYKNM